MVDKPLAFSVETTRAAGSVLVHLRGELDVYTAPTLRDTLNDLIEGQGNLTIVLALEEMTFIDSTGVGVFVGALKRIRDKGGNLELQGASAGTAKVLEISGAKAVFDRLVP